MSTANPSSLGDCELAATLHALTAPMLAHSVAPHVDLADRGIDFAALLDQPWSHGERAMIEVACTLWGREDIADVRLSPVLYTLDDDNFQRVIEAMLIRRGQYQLPAPPVDTAAHRAPR